MNTRQLLAAALLVLSALPSIAQSSLLGTSSTPASLGPSRAAHPPASRRLEYSPEMLAIYRRYIDAAALNDASHPKLRAELDRMVSEGKCIFASALEATEEYLLAFKEKEMNRDLSSVDLKRRIVRVAEAKREIGQLANDPARAIPIAACFDAVIRWTGVQHDDRKQGLAERNTTDSAALEVYHRQYARALAHGQRRAASESGLRTQIDGLIVQFGKTRGGDRDAAVLEVTIELATAELNAWTGSRAD